jgi:hypothetical protein
MILRKKRALGMEQIIGANIDPREKSQSEQAPRGLHRPEGLKARREG